VGLSSNLLLYVLYLGLTAFDVPPSIALIAVYAVAILYSYFFNMRWSFEKSSSVKQITSYIAVYVAAYFLNVAALHWGVEVTALPHQIVQLFLIPIAAVLIFLALRLWVFRTN